MEDNKTFFFDRTLLKINLQRMFLSQIGREDQVHEAQKIEPEKKI
jgi:hypothetical protein